MFPDSKDVLNAAAKRNTAAEEATLTSTKCETGADGSKVTTHISTTTNKTKGMVNTTINTTTFIHLWGVSIELMNTYFQMVLRPPQSKHDRLPRPGVLVVQHTTSQKPMQVIIV